MKKLFGEKCASITEPRYESPSGKFADRNQKTRAQIPSKFTLYQAPFSPQISILSIGLPFFLLMGKDDLLPLSELRGVAWRGTSRGTRNAGDGGFELILMGNGVHYQAF